MKSKKSKTEGERAPSPMRGGLHESGRKGDDVSSHSARLLSSLFRCSLLMDNTRSSIRLMREVCKTLVQTGGYKVAWINRFERGRAEVLQTSAWWGTGRKDQELFRLVWMDEGVTAAGSCISGSSGKASEEVAGKDPSVPLILTHISAIPAFGPACIFLKARAQRYGFAALASFPLQRGSKIMGSLTVCSSNPDDFDSDERDLLGEFAGHLARRIVDLEKPHSRKQMAAHVLEKERNFLQNLIDTIPSPIFYKDSEGRYRGCNKTFEARLGLSRNEIIGKLPHDLFQAEVAEIYHEMDMALLKAPGTQHHEGELIYADGSVHDVIINKGTFLNADGTLGGLVGVLVDITERKQAERALLKAHDELDLRVHERTAELATANEELRNEVVERKRAEDALRASSEQLKFFSYSVTHDLKSPTIGLRGLAMLLLKQYGHTLDERGRHYCDQILKVSEQIVGLVDKINAYISTRETALKLDSVKVGEIVEMIRDEFSPVLSIRQVSLSYDEAIPELMADRLSLVRVFRNLVDNALKYGGRELREIHVGYRGARDEHILYVQDDGVGIRSEDRERVFELFQRHETSRGVEGSGLGLAIVKGVAERHGGRAWVEPGPEKGTVFYFSLARDV